MNRRSVVPVILGVLLVALATGPAAQAASFVFSGPGDTATGPAPYCVAVGDFDGDGRQDLATADYGGAATSVLLGYGDGTFAANTDYATGAGPYGVAVGDFDGDGAQDLATADYDANTVSVLLGSGDGTFAARTAFATDVGPGGITVGDFDGDGAQDLATADHDANTVSVLLGNGDGTFAPKADYATGGGPYMIAGGDFDNDGIRDLTTANSDANTVSVLLGNGDGTFAGKTDFATGGFPVSVAVGDFDADGNQDLATANGGSVNVSVLLGNGDGTFATRIDHTCSTAPYAVAVGDFDSDGTLDLVTADHDAKTVSVLLGNGDGTFTAEGAFAVGTNPFWIAVGDFDGDGRQDLAVANAGSDTVSVLLGDGAAGFAPPLFFAAGTDPGSLAMADFDGDNAPDAATTATMSDGWGTYRRVAVLRGDGHGDLGTPSYFSAGSDPQCVATGDLNGDGKPDLVAASSSDRSVAVLLGDGAGSFAVGRFFAVAFQPDALVVADFNNDGKQDVAASGYWPEGRRDIPHMSLSRASILLGDGSGDLGPASAPQSFNGSSTDCAVGDFDGDGNQDLVVVGYWTNFHGDYGADTDLFRGDGSGGLGQRSTVVSMFGYGGCGVAAADFNTDGKLDLATVVRPWPDRQLGVLLGDGNGGFGPPSPVYDEGGDIAVADVNDDGNQDLVVGDFSRRGVVVLAGHGDGGFGRAGSYPTPPSPTTGLFGTTSNPVAVACADLDRDGRLDILAAGRDNDGLAVLLNRSGQWFAVDGDADYARAAAVTLGSGVRGATEMRFRDAGDTWTGWQTYARQRAWTLPAGDGAKTVEAEYRDGGGAAVAAVSDDITLDTVAPTTTQSGGGDAWRTAPVKVTLSASDATSGVAVTEYKLDAGAWTTGTSVTVSTDGDHTVAYRSIDNAGNVETTQICHAKVDQQAPATIDDAPTAWRPGPVLVTLTATDAGSGVAYTEYRIDYGSAQQGTQALITGDGVHRLDYRSVDNVGHVETVKTTYVRIDTVAPVTTQSGADDAWHASVTVTLTSSDAASGVATTEYKLDAGAWAAGTKVTVASDGDHTLTYRSTDNAGNVEKAQACHVKIDRTPPTTTDDADAAWHNADVTVHFAASDAASGVQYTKSRVDGSVDWTKGAAVVVPALADHSNDGTHTILYRSADNVDNVETARTCTTRIDTRSPTTAALARARVRRGRTVTLKYRVKDQVPNGGTATVVIEVKRGGTVVKTLTPGVKAVNTSLRYKFACKLRKGTYRFFVYATDAAGNVQSAIGSKRLIVR